MEGPPGKPPPPPGRFEVAPGTAVSRWMGWKARFGVALSQRLLLTHVDSGLDRDTAYRMVQR